MASDQGALLAEIINQGFAWVQAREAFRRIDDSKRATEADRAKAVKRAFEAGNRLEKSFIELLKLSGGRAPVRRKNPTLPVDWSKVVGAIAKGAGAIENVLSAKKGPITEVIDTEGREV